MKKITLIAVAAILIGFSSCSKNKEYCWECEISVYHWEKKWDHYPDTAPKEWVLQSQESDIYCGLTEEEINSVKQMGTKYNYPSDGWKTVTACDKK